MEGGNRRWDVPAAQIRAGEAETFLHLNLQSSHLDKSRQHLSDWRHTWTLPFIWGDRGLCCPSPVLTYLVEKWGQVCLGNTPLVILIYSSLLPPQSFPNGNEQVQSQILTWSEKIASKYIDVFSVELISGVFCVVFLNGFPWLDSPPLEIFRFPRCRMGWGYPAWRLGED